MSELSTYWTRRRRLIEECRRCDESNRFLLLACPLYILFPVFLLAVVPLYVLFLRIRHLSLTQLQREQENICHALSGVSRPDLVVKDPAQWIIGQDE